jgi:hypothetical protein
VLVAAEHLSCGLGCGVVQRHGRVVVQLRPDPVVADAFVVLVWEARDLVHIVNLQQTCVVEVG